MHSAASPRSESRAMKRPGPVAPAVATWLAGTCRFLPSSSKGDFDEDLTQTLPPLLRFGAEPSTLLDREARVEHALLVERLADHLQAERQPVRVEPGRYAHRRQPGEACRDREHVGEVHRQRVVELVAERGR